MSYLCCSKIVMVVMPCRFSLSTITTGCKCPFVPSLCRTNKNEITLQVQHRNVMFVNTQIPKMSIFLMCKYTKYVNIHCTKMQNTYTSKMQIQKYVKMQNMYIFNMQIHKICKYSLHIDAKYIYF